LVEGGARLATSFLREGLVDKIIWVTVPVLIGHGVSSLGDLGIRKVTESIRLRDIQEFSSGPDRILVGYVR
jgi:diaminohydroxyphosphoribosylaminopyrimidine deaminase/5-amino-6-(5-phosphoribosylamino)uracil reductase